MGGNLDLCMLAEGLSMDLVPTLFIVTIRSSNTLSKANVEGLIILYGGSKNGIGASTARS